MQSDKKPGRPTWAKVPIVVGIIGVLTMAAIITGGIFLTEPVQADEADLVSIKRLAADIGDFTNPLPGGFEYVRAINQLPARELLIENKKEGMHIAINCLEVKPGDSFNKSFRESFEKNYDAGLAESGVRDFVETSHETLKIGGVPFDLKIGHCSSPDGSLPFMRARNEFPTKVIVFIAAGRPGRDFDVNLFKRFASGIRHF